MTASTRFPRENTTSSPLRMSVAVQKKGRRRSSMFRSSKTEIEEIADLSFGDKPGNAQLRRQVAAQVGVFEFEGEFLDFPDTVVEAVEGADQRAHAGSGYQAGTIPRSSRTRSIPMWAYPLAPPPPRAIPMVNDLFCPASFSLRESLLYS